jgi:hypothetical protein
MTIIKYVIGIILMLITHYLLREFADLYQWQYALIVCTSAIAGASVFWAIIDPIHKENISKELGRVEGKVGTIDSLPYQVQMVVISVIQYGNGYLCTLRTPEYCRCVYISKTIPELSRGDPVVRTPDSLAKVTV